MERSKSIFPVRGDMNEPDFRYGRVVLNALVNLITKIAASPFAAHRQSGRRSWRGPPVRGFRPGEARITEKDRSKLRSLKRL